MNVPDEIDDLIGVLRSPALVSELVDENRTVAAMAGAFHSSEGKASMHITSRRARIGVLIATGIIGFGGVAAAGPGGVFDANDDVVEASTTTTEAVAASTTIALTTSDAEPLPPSATSTVAPPEEDEEAAEEARTAPIEVLTVEGEAIPLVDDPSTTFDETMCLAGNHGKTVSAVAHGELDGIDGEDIAVRDAAHSSCGKRDADADAVEPEEDNESVEANESDETTDETAPAKEKKSGHSTSNGHGQSNGQGHGNGKGD